MSRARWSRLARVERRSDTDWGHAVMERLEQKRKDVAELRHVRIARRQPFMANHLERPGFRRRDRGEDHHGQDRRTGAAWAPAGRSRADHAPVGHRSGTGALRPSSPPCARSAPAACRSARSAKRRINAATAETTISAAR